MWMEEFWLILGSSRKETETDEEPKIYSLYDSILYSMEMKSILKRTALCGLSLLILCFFLF